ncbi:hypothetical protein [Corynebacterium jeikeium]|uniref:hypothetical protein n=1 Tax=Corynebacterium jeikeium TaxID=38289 RepID=UPI000A971682|nr:hypothetical protein [Corynebacterium jeikeium]
MTQLRLTMRQRQDRARVIVTASKKTGDILPRHIYERAGAPVPITLLAVPLEGTQDSYS